jgi:hypothetical protein
MKVAIIFQKISILGLNHKRRMASPQKERKRKIDFIKRISLFIYCYI